MFVLEVAKLFQLLHYSAGIQITTSPVLSTGTSSLCSSLYTLNSLSSTVYSVTKFLPQNFCLGSTTTEIMHHLRKKLFFPKYTHISLCYLLKRQNEEAFITSIFKLRLKPRMNKKVEVLSKKWRIYFSLKTLKQCRTLELKLRTTELQKFFLLFMVLLHCFRWCNCWK